MFVPILQIKFEVYKSKI